MGMTEMVDAKDAKGRKGRKVERSTRGLAALYLCVADTTGPQDSGIPMNTAAFPLRPLRPFASFAYPIQSPIGARTP
jgi:hypothetical protein